MEARFVVVEVCPKQKTWLEVDLEVAKLIVFATTFKQGLAAVFMKEQKPTVLHTIIATTIIVTIIVRLKQSSIIPSQQPIAFLSSFFLSMPSVLKVLSPFMPLPLQQINRTLSVHVLSSPCFLQSDHTCHTCLFLQHIGQHDQPKTQSSKFDCNTGMVLV